MSRKRVTAATSVVAQAKARAEVLHKVVPLLSEAAKREGKASIGVLHSHIDETPDPETRSPRLRVIIPGKKNSEIYELTRLLVQPKLARFLAEGFRHWSSTISIRTRVHICDVLNHRVGSFLSTLTRQMAPSAIDEVYWATFIAWLNGPRRSNGTPWAMMTRGQAVGAMKGCISALLDHSEHGAVATALMEKSGFPHNSWPGRSRRNVPTAVLSAPERCAMIMASLGEIAALSERMDEREAILGTGRALLDDARTDGCAPPYNTAIGICAALVAEAFPNRLASQKDLFALDRALGNAVMSKHGMLAVRRLLYATFRDLVPFVLLIGAKTAFNPDTILSLTWSRVRISANGRTVTFLGIKNRAAGLQVSINPDDATGDCDFPAEPNVPFGLADLLALLRQLTRRTREILADLDHGDRLFIGVPVWGSTNAKGYVSKYGLSSDPVWKSTLRGFIEDNGLAPFTLAMLRPSEGEEEWRRTGDLLAVRDRLGHKSITTTRTHYTSDGMRRESQERVAETQAFYHRWAQTEGRVDPRHQPERCRSAATPGFGCLDPFDSPRLGQRKGKLCTAYGECPDCPLAQAWPRDVQAAAYYLALPKAIHDARLGRISPKHWTKKWPPILIAHNGLLEAIPPDVRADASKFRIELKPVG